MKKGQVQGKKSNMTSNNILVMCFLPKKIGKVRERGGRENIKKAPGQNVSCWGENEQQFG